MPTAPNPAAAAAPAEAITALRHRARSSLASSAFNPHPKAADNFRFWQGYAKALFDLDRGAGAKLAAKDASLGGYQPSPAFARAIGLLADDIERLSRVEVQQRVAEAGIDIATEPVSYLDVISAGEAEHGEVAPGGHGGSVAKQGGAQ